MHNEIEANKARDTVGSRRLLAAVIAQAIRDLKDPAHRKSSVEFFWGANKNTSTTYLSLLGYDAADFQRKLKEKFEAGTLEMV